MKLAAGRSERSTSANPIVPVADSSPALAAGLIASATSATAPDCSPDVMTGTSLVPWMVTEMVRVIPSPSPSVTV
ncbi:MAG: hypothetical protein WBB98_07150 [Xanthobacteraceae bacterium]